MNTSSDPSVPGADPFGEHQALPLRCSLPLLGGCFEFRAADADLFSLVQAAYLGLPALAATGGRPDFVVELRRLPSPAPLPLPSTPALPRMWSGSGLLGLSGEDGSVALVDPAGRRGLACLGPAWLQSPYHARYEMLEFVVFTLATRSLGWVPLHAGCVSHAGQAALLVGESGAGKSTLSLLAMQAGLDFVTEDGSFVTPDGRVLGISNFVHLRADALRFLSEDWRARAQAAPKIRRRSGVEKYELDLRGGWARLAPEPARLAQLVFVTPAVVADGPLLRRLDASEVPARLLRSQAYAAGQPGWSDLLVRVAGLPAWEMRRGRHPADGAQALHALLA